MPRQRNYRAEYERRIAKGKGLGRSVSESRGHGAPKSGFDRKLQSIVRDYEHGRYKSVAEAARKGHVPPEKLANYIRATEQGHKQGGRIVLGQEGGTPPRDSYHVPIVVVGEGIQEIDVRRDQATFVGQYMSAVGQYVRTGDESALAPFVGKTVKDVNGNEYELETDLDALTDVYSYESVDWDEIYRRNG